jgi:polygalacturonase
MGDGIIDGRAGERMLGTKVSWWDLPGHLPTGRHQQVPRILLADYSDNFTLYRITLKNSPFFHVVYNHGNGFTIWGLKIDTPKLYAPNADGIDPGAGSKNITITHSFIRAGDDNVAIKGGEGGVTNMTVSHNHFYWGHGMSIGSETNGGVSKIRVFDLSLDGPDSGIRIKSNTTRGGLVHDVVYDDVCIRDSPYPINIDSRYSLGGKLPGDLIPEYRDVTLHNVRISGGGLIWIHGYSSDHRAAVNLDGVLLTDADRAKYTYSIDHADIHLGPGPVNLQPIGTDSTLTGTAGSGSLGSCESKFVPFPHP